MNKIDPTLHFLQADFGGDIGATYPLFCPVALVCNDEEKLIELDLTNQGKVRLLSDVGDASL